MVPLSPAPNWNTLSLKLTEHRALIFDVYGTLIDWESAIHDALVPIFAHLPRKEILVNYSKVEGNLQTQFQTLPYSRILEMAYRQLTTSVEGELRNEQRGSTSESLNLNGEDVHPPSDSAERFGGSIPDWKPFPDTIDALHRLKKHFALVVLSNVDDQSFQGTHTKLCDPNYPGSAFPTVTPDSPFSLILTAQQVGAYKPNPLMLECALRQLSENPDSSLPSNPLVCMKPWEVLVVANSLRHDIVPAMQHELRSVWISRHGVNCIGNESDLAIHHSDQEGATGGKCPYAWRYETLGRMADVVEGEKQKHWA